MYWFTCAVVCASWPWVASCLSWAINASSSGAAFAIGRQARKEEAIAMDSLNMFKPFFDFPQTSADADALAIGEDCDMVSRGNGLQLLHAPEVQDGRAAHPAEHLARELGFQPAHRLAQDVRALAQVQDGVIAGGFHPVDLLRRDECRALAAAHHQPRAALLRLALG